MSNHDTPYEGLADDLGDHRWAFGTGFSDPLAGVDATLPAGVDAGALAAYCLMLADDALIYSQRLQQWMTRAPELEEEAALANVALDLLGQARLLLARAAQAEGAGRDEDGLAFFRAPDEFRNVRLAERADADFAEVVGRLLVFATWRLALCERLRDCADPVLAAIAAKAVAELAYHRDYAARWVVRLGDGTDVSHTRMQRAVDALWPDVAELFDPVPVEAPTVVVDAANVRGEVDAVLDTVFATATLDRPAATAEGTPRRGGRAGVHTDAFADLVTEMQSVARAHPDATW